MEQEQIEVTHEMDKDRTRNEPNESTKLTVEDPPIVVPTSPRKDMQAVAWKGGGIDDETVQQVETSAVVNMAASIKDEDIIRAGGFGARDDISNFLPVASDGTDFEASLRDARDYEEPQEKVSRPGLGWREASE